MPTATNNGLALAMEAATRTVKLRGPGVMLGVEPVASWDGEQH